mmetsp:Transcript_38315/g.59602  ORF Transcript_38315/g.59602 Transcript_38315/m.59602 type:complete len:133 (-) Transcript_38315:14-412(-)
MLWSVGELAVTIERDQAMQPEVRRRKSRVYLVDAHGNSRSSNKLKLHCPVDDLPHMSVGECDGTECAICFEDYEDPETRVVVLPCNHVFHPLCAARWFSQKAPGKMCCPLCKQCPRLKQDVEEEEASEGDML